LIEWGEGPAIMGILNLTPDSFSDGGTFRVSTDDASASKRATTRTADEIVIDVERAVQHAEQMVREGASIIDVGGQSTRPNFKEISAADEIVRVIPVIAALAPRIDRPISVDTYKPAVARAALTAGAHLLNDVRGLQGDPQIAVLAAEFQVPVVIMHQDAAFRSDPTDSIEKMLRYFERSLEIATAAGVPREHCILDPGIGFLKTHHQNLEIIGRLGELRALGLPILLGVSRKSTIGEVLDLPSDERLEGTLATTSLAAWQGIEMVRVHDVQANVRAARMAAALRQAARPD
jgi:dihydropteroate synthase